MPQPLSYRVSPKLLLDGTYHHLILRQNDCRPSLAGILFESHLTYASRSPNSKTAALYGLPYSLKYADESGLDVEGRLLHGHPFLPHEMRAFAHWFEMRFKKYHAQKHGPADYLPASRRKTFNNILYGIQKFKQWFVETYHQTTTPGMRAAEAANIQSTQKRLWEKLHQPIKQKPEAGDLARETMSSPSTFSPNKQTLISCPKIRPTPYQRKSASKRDKTPSKRLRPI